MDEPRIGRQTPTRSVTIPYDATLGPDAIRCILTPEERHRNGSSFSPMT